MGNRFRTGMSSPIRKWIFDWYVWITVVGGIAAGILMWWLSKTENFPNHLITLCTIALGAIYFIQKQKSEDLQIFEKLFSKFNETYRGMHANLTEILADELEIDAKRRAILDAYFNLCAEEYLFFQEGRILPEVWQAWCRGMLLYLKDIRIREYFVAEEKNGSHYGLTAKTIETGARRSLESYLQQENSLVVSAAN